MIFRGFKRGLQRLAVAIIDKAPLVASEGARIVRDSFFEDAPDIIQSPRDEPPMAANEDTPEAEAPPPRRLKPHGPPSFPLIPLSEHYESGLNRGALRPRPSSDDDSLSFEWEDVDL